MIDTTGIPAGSTFALKLSNTDIGQDSDLVLSGGDPAPITISNGTIATVPSVVGRHIFYNNSYFDGNNVGANAADDSAIATDKQALLPGQTATLANYTSYNKGINGIMVDFTGAPHAAAISAADFTFADGNSATPGSWITAPTPLSVTDRPSAGIGGSDRVEIIWADGSVEKQWLQITVKADANTGLSAPDVFYFGNAPGDNCNSTTNTYVDGSDFAGARDDPRNFVNRASITNMHDYNRDSFVDGSDLAIARDNNTNFLNALKLITAPANGGVSSLSLGAAQRAISTTQSAGAATISPASTTFSAASESINVGAIQLLPNTAGQVVTLSISGSAPVTGFNLRAQLGDGTGPKFEPHFQSISFGTGTIWAGHTTTITGGPIAGNPQFAQASVVLNNSGDHVAAAGMLLKLTITTVGLAAGSYPLLLSGTQIRADSTVILAGGQEQIPTIVNGSITLKAPPPKGTITGVIFNDVNSDGIRQSNEGGLAKRLIYIDRNGDGRFDAGDLSSSSSASGTWSFTGLTAGTYLVRVAASAGWKPTRPTLLKLTLGTGQTKSNNLFSEHKV